MQNMTVNQENATTDLMATLNLCIVQIERSILDEAFDSLRWEEICSGDKNVMIMR